MDKVKIPRDWSKSRDNFFSHLFHFTSTKAWVFLSLIFAIGVMGLLGIKGQNALNYGWLFGVLIALFIGLPLFFRFKYFREIPEGWTREQFKAWQKIEGKTHKIVDNFSRKYWFVVLCIVSIFVGLGIALNEIGLVAIVPGILTISFFVYIFRIAYQAREKMSDAQIKNMMALNNASYDAKYSKANKSVLKKMAVAVIFVIMFFLFSIGGKFLLLNKMQSIILFGGIVSLVIGFIIWRSINKKELSDNEKTLEKLRKKFGMKN